MDTSLHVSLEKKLSAGFQQQQHEKERRFVSQRRFSMVELRNFARSWCWMLSRTQPPVAAASHYVASQRQKAHVYFSANPEGIHPRSELGCLSSGQKCILLGPSSPFIGHNHADHEWTHVAAAFTSQQQPSGCLQLESFLVLHFLCSASSLHTFLEE